MIGEQNPNPKDRGQEGEPQPSGLVRKVPIDSIQPSKINDLVYRPPSPQDPDIQAMAENMREIGVLQPLNVTKDRFILSGHRRYCAATLAGLTEIPVIFESVLSTDPDFPKLLVYHNQQRQKNIAEIINEQVVQVSADQAHRRLVQHRIASSQRCMAGATAMVINKTRKRSKISHEKLPMLEAVVAVLDELHEFWPLSLRTIHYNLLNKPPLRNASNKESFYCNDEKSYKDLSNLVTRARMEGEILFDAIHDPTRPLTTWNTHRNASDYIREQMSSFLGKYWRDLLQSQPNHIEVVGEKNTLLPIIRPICSDYTVPLTIGRGFCSIPPRKAMLDRWKESGKNKLIIILLTDHDPDGQMIAESMVGYMRDDFGIPKNRIDAFRAAISSKQCKDHNIPKNCKAKETSTNYKTFHFEHGDDACELEAVPPKLLQKFLRDSIESVLDKQAFKAEQDREIKDAQEIDQAKQRAMVALAPAFSQAGFGQTKGCGD